jgi:thiol-disulfide isomerase/thioredoxin
MQSDEESCMKRIGLILVTLIGIVAFALLANRATRIPVTRATRTSQVNKPAPLDFMLKDLNDHDVGLAQFKGEVVLVNFWATWCVPCRIEIPWLIELQDKYSARRFTVLGVAMDEEGKNVVAPFVQNERFKVGEKRRTMNYPVLIGNDATTQKFGGLIGFPTSILISRDGRIVRRFDGLLSQRLYRNCFGRASMVSPS